VSALPGLAAAQVVNFDDPVWSVLRYCTNGAVICFAEALPKETVELLAERLNDHLLRITGVPASACACQSQFFSQQVLQPNTARDPRNEGD
jgi:hypothetical protein